MSDNKLYIIDMELHIIEHTADYQLHMNAKLLHMIDY